MRFILAIMIMFFSLKNAFALEIKSDAFVPASYIPAQYTCDGEDISPGINWNDSPAGTESFVLICDDPDAPMGTWVHWVIFNIPSDKAGLQEGIPKTAILDDGTIQGVTDFGRNGYGGPCPPPGKPHRYFFKLYALDTKLTLDKDANKAAVLRTIKGHVIAETETFGLYKR